MRFRDIEVGKEYCIRLTKKVKAYFEEEGIDYKPYTPVTVDGVYDNGDPMSRLIEFTWGDDVFGCYPREIMPVPTLEQLMEDFIKNERKLHS